MPKARTNQVLTPTLARLSRTVAARIPGTLDDPELVGTLRDLGAAWLLADSARLKPDAAGRFRVENSASRALTRVARSVSRMVDVRQSHGPKATRLAARVLLDLRSGLLDMERLIGRAARFRTLRRDYLNSEVTGPVENVALHGGAFRASRMSSPAGLEQLGHETGGSLLDPDVLRFRAERLRRRSVAIWRIDPVDAPWMDDDRPIWIVVLSGRTGSVEEVEHVANAVTVPVDRDVLLEFLASRERRGKGCVQTAALAQHAISPALVEAARVGTVRRFDAPLAGTTWRFEIAPGLLTAIALDDEACLAGRAVSAVTLTGPSVGGDMIYSILSGWCGSNEEDSEPAADCGFRGHVAHDSDKSSPSIPG